jgi:metallophosphoesterase (TIGR03767 family)
VSKTIALALAALVVMPTVPAAGATTAERTIRDTDGDNLLEHAPGERHVVLNGPPGFVPPSRGSILNFLQLSDFQMVDEESPGRVEFLDTTQRGPFAPFSAAYRPQESLTTQITEAMVREVRGEVSPFTGIRPALSILTGDNADSQQFNETRWFIDILDGGRRIDPDSGIPSGLCPHGGADRYDGVQGSAQYYDPDGSAPGTDGPGYSPDRATNAATTGRDVTVRDFPNLFVAANQPFPAAGLGMPWYSAFGNHDALVQGNSPDAYTGPFGPTGESWLPPTNTLFHQIVTGCLKPTADGPATVHPEPGPGTATVVPPDPRRCFLAKDRPTTSPPGPCHSTSWIQQHFVTSGRPRGHGFAPTSSLPWLHRIAGYGRPNVAIVNHDGYYSFSPTGGLRFVVLDTVTDECGTQFCSEGSVDDDQFRWLEGQILRAGLMRQYVFVFSHHTLRTTRWPTTDPTEQPVHYGQRIDQRGGQPQNPGGGTTLEELYCRHPNVLAHIAGHEHENYVERHDCDGTPAGEAVGPGDFWHVSTAAHIDWPQQSRMIELIDNGDRTMSLAMTMIDHAGPPDPGSAAFGSGDAPVARLASVGRELAYNDFQGSREALGAPEDRNVIIVIDRPWVGGTDGSGEDDDEDEDDD